MLPWSGPVAALERSAGSLFVPQIPMETKGNIALLSVMAGVLMLGESIVKILGWFRQ